MKYSDTIILHDTFVFKGGGDEINSLCFASTSFKKLKNFPIFWCLIQNRIQYFYYEY